MRILTCHPDPTLLPLLAIPVVEFRRGKIDHQPVTQRIDDDILAYLTVPQAEDKPPLPLHATRDQAPGLFERLTSRHGSAPSPSKRRVTSSALRTHRTPAGGRACRERSSPLARTPEVIATVAHEASGCAPPRTCMVVAPAARLSRSLRSLPSLRSVTAPPSGAVWQRRPGRGERGRRRGASAGAVPRRAGPILVDQLGRRSRKRQKEAAVDESLKVDGQRLRESAVAR